MTNDTRQSIIHLNIGVNSIFLKGDITGIEIPQEISQYLSSRTITNPEKETLLFPRKGGVIINNTLISTISDKGEIIKERIYSLMGKVIRVTHINNQVKKVEIK